MPQLVAPGRMLGSPRPAAAMSTAWPSMVADSDGGYLMSASSVSFGAAYKVHDGDTTSASRWAGASATDWLKVQFPSPRKWTGYTLTPYPSLYPTGWTLDGSADGSTGWTTLDTRASQAFPSDLARTFSLSSPDAYLAYRITFTGFATGSTSVLIEWTATAAP